MERRSLLIVDDDPLVLKALARLLARDYDVSALSSPAEALRRLAEGARWHAILCDVHMPEMSGLEFARRAVLAQPALARRIALITGGAPPAEARSLEQTAFPVLRKPIQLPVLRRVLDRLLPGT